MHEEDFFIFSEVGVNLVTFKKGWLQRQITDTKHLEHNSFHHIYLKKYLFRLESHDKFEYHKKLENSH